MIVAVHGLMGAALGRVCRSRRQAFAAGFLSHMVADLLPHRDLDIPEEALLLGGVLSIVGLRYGADSKEFAGALGAALPDLENLVGRTLNIPDKRLLLPTHRGWHGRRTRGFGGQIALALACAAALMAGRPDSSRTRGRGKSSR